MIDSSLIGDSFSEDDVDWYEPESVVTPKCFKRYARSFVWFPGSTKHSWHVVRPPVPSGSGLVIYKHGVATISEPSVDLIIFGGTESGSRRDPSLVQAFDQLVEQWEAETAFLSNVSVITSHPAYLRILALGPRVVPLILERLRMKPNHWFKALCAFAGEDIAFGSETIPSAVEAWLEWGHQTGYLTD